MKFSTCRDRLKRGRIGIPGMAFENSVTEGANPARELFATLGIRGKHRRAVGHNCERACDHHNTVPDRNRRGGHYPLYHR